ncbi:MAG: PEP-CTERM sorting domain-containing protein [Xanthomonadales bacterium]|nr:PEP-CTERM sorting domain-containing protein [Xanthomonadales bacterium]
MKLTHSIGRTLGFLLLALAPVALVHANALSITYYTIATADQDVNHLAGGSFDNEVQAQLGPNGLPVLNTAAYGCTSNCFTAMPLPLDVTSTGELTWWSPALNSNVTQTGTGVVNLPFNVPYNFFPPNGTGSNDSRGFQSAILSGVLSVPSTQTISFSIGADDAAFAYLDGTVVCNLGGVHPITAGTCVTPFSISAGSHQLDVFFVDLNAVQSGLTFDVTTTGITTVPPANVPEPAELGLFGLGLALIGLLVGVRRRCN